MDRLPDDDELFVRAVRRLAPLSEEQVERARDLQRRMREMGLTPKPLAEILLETGAVDADGHRRAVEAVQRVKEAFRIPGYKLLEKLGRGSMGVVYKARQLNLDRVVAIKVLSKSLAKNEGFVRRFLKEARVVGRLNHPNVVQGFDAGAAGGVYYFAMEYCDGPTVLQILKRGGAVDEGRALKIVTQVARALDHAHEEGLVHRDVKPDNIMIVEGGTAKLCDLGLAKDLSIESGSTADGATVGTPNYISPEQARGDAVVDIRSDIYSLGATFYHLLTGVPPFDGPNPAVIMVKHLNEPPTPPRHRRPELAPAVERIVLKMLAKNPRDRYQTPAALLRDLEAAAGGGASARSPAAPARAPVSSLSIRTRRRPR
ncbi:MAG TPA: serine/threonine-protein kinase [Planctomycetota bacterium]|nr:serine/threonine-protein kinase [Planctomycetota bacterium]